VHRCVDEQDYNGGTTKLQRDILWWAKAATWVGVTIILVMIALTALSYILPTD
jgi:hypothetical protein